MRQEVNPGTLSSGSTLSVMHFQALRLFEPLMPFEYRESPPKLLPTSSTPSSDPPQASSGNRISVDISCKPEAPSLGIPFDFVLLSHF